MHSSVMLPALIGGSPLLKFDKFIIMFETIRQKSAYRSVRYSTIRKDTFTPQNSQHRLSLYSVKPAQAAQSTFYQTRTITLKPQTTTNFYTHNPERQNYLQSFHSMLDSQKRVKDKQDDSFKACSLKIKFENFDDNFLKDDGTEFTLLDPFHRPHTYLTNQLRKQEKELKSQKDEIRLIRAEMSTMKRNVIISLKNSEDQGSKGIEKLRQLIRKNQIQSQEIKMHVRRQITELYQKHDQNVQLEELLSNKSKEMQRQIFNCQPFELQAEVASDS